MKLLAPKVSCYSTRLMALLMPASFAGNHNNALSLHRTRIVCDVQNVSHSLKTHKINVRHKCITLVLYILTLIELELTKTTDSENCRGQ